MADSLLSRLIFDTDTPEHRRLRRIESEYHLAIVAENSEQIRQFQADALDLQAAQLRMAAEQHREVSHLLAQLSFDLDGIHSTLGWIVDGLADVEEAIHLQSKLLLHCFEQEAKLLVELQHSLQKVIQQQAARYRTDALEVRNEALAWLTAGLKTTGRERDDSLDDALRLFRITAENPIGGQDCIVWFNIGWLLWKHRKDIAGAEEAFFRAARLSALHNADCRRSSLRHLAEMQYLQQKYQEAYETSGRARDYSPDHDVRYDLARYASAAGRREEALQLVETCIVERPASAYSVFTEPDFLGSTASGTWEPDAERTPTYSPASVSQEDLRDLSGRLLQDARLEVGSRHATHKQLLEEINELLKNVDLTLEWPARLTTDLLALVEAALPADYPTVRASLVEIRAVFNEVKPWTDQALVEERRRREDVATAREREAEALRRELEDAANELLTQLERELDPHRPWLEKCKPWEAVATPVDRFICKQADRYSGDIRELGCVAVWLWASPFVLVVSAALWMVKLVAWRLYGSAYQQHRLGMEEAFRAKHEELRAAYGVRMAEVEEAHRMALQAIEALDRAETEVADAIERATDQMRKAEQIKGF